MIKRIGIVFQPSRIYCRCVMRGVAAVGAEAGWEWLLIPPGEAVALAQPSAASLDGIIGDFGDDGSMIELSKSGLPIVDISPGEIESKAVRVGSDDVAVGRLAAAYLLSLGLAHYGFFGVQGRAASQSREDGFTSTITAAGFRCEQFRWPADNPQDDLEKWISGLPKPVGVLANDDSHAMQLLFACHKLAITVPDAVAVVGVDNDEMFCEFANPSLSSVALSTQRIGHEAARTLQRLMRNQEPEQARLLVPPAGVVPRQSSARKVIVDPDVAAAVRYIAMHVKDDLQVADVMREVLMSRRTLDQRFLHVLGRTPAQEISRAQVDLAKQVLAETDEPMTRVAAMAGFSNAKQFGATFREAIGMTPTAYRKKHRPTLGGLIAAGVGNKMGGGITCGLPPHDADARCAS